MCRDRFQFIFRATFFISLGLLTLLPAISLAQDNPCDDPFNPPPGCDVPLDTFVWVLVAAALLFGAWYLYRQQKIAGRV